VKEDAPPHMVPLTKIKQRVDAQVVKIVLDQPVVVGYTVVVDISLMLSCSPPQYGRLKGKLHRLLH
jgi:predicted transcriptional regulator